jgi:hypothetical protein
MHIPIDFRPAFTHRRCGTGFEPRSTGRTPIEYIKEDLLIETRSNNCANLERVHGASAVKDFQDNGHEVIDLSFKKDRRPSDMQDIIKVLFVSLPVSTNRAFVDPEELPNYAERAGGNSGGARSCVRGSIVL